LSLFSFKVLLKKNLKNIWQQLSSYFLSFSFFLLNFSFFSSFLLFSGFLVVSFDLVLNDSLSRNSKNMLVFLQRTLSFSSSF